MGLRGGTSDRIDGIRILSNVCKIGKDFNSIAGNEGTEDIFSKIGPVFDHFLQKVQKRIKKSKNLRGNRKMGWTMFC